mmetsp:Transcript_59274/g.176335  ORF Transcript_59274/g.176335 Transcript_59274/m.176335 type:complete len:244 (+) Transcript_59274:168-899(+)
MFPVCERATPSKDVMAAPRSRVSARKTARFSSATSARSSWSTIRLLSSMADSVSSCAVSSRPKGSRSPNGISVSMSMLPLAWAGASSSGACDSARAPAASSFSFSFSSSPSSFAMRRKPRGPFASFESGSVACCSASCAAKRGASKVTWSTFPSGNRLLETTFTSVGLHPVASEMPREKSWAKSFGRGALTFSCAFCKVKSSMRRCEERSFSSCFILSRISISDAFAAGPAPACCSAWCAATL